MERKRKKEGKPGVEFFLNDQRAAAQVVQGPGSEASFASGDL